MHFISIQIVRFTNGSQPGWVEGQFVDAEGHRHIIIEKVPVLTTKDLDADSGYPTPGSLPCEVLKEFRDESGRELVCVTTPGP